ncbi:hypothetical protein ONZ45_g4618 [Pleurotus djamor]|nr:hypothetical protein ONZ45_g4618 [Pleurotus djamor]
MPQSLTASTSVMQTTKPAVSSSLRIDTYPSEQAKTVAAYPSDIDASDSGSASDSTVEDLDSVMDQYNFGHPLERMPIIPSRYTYGVPSHNMELGDGEDARDDDSYSEYSESECSTSSSMSYDIDFEAIVDDLISELDHDLPKSRNLIRVEASSPSAHDAFVIRPLSENSLSNEYDILMSFNTSEARLDPWNPVPHVLSVVNKPQPNANLPASIFVCLEWLTKYDDPPFQTVANYIDFIRQALEGLTFLHEHHVTSLNFSTPDSFMVDIGRRNTWLHTNVPISPCLDPSSKTWPSSHLASHELPQHVSSQPFDRTRYPVRYFYVDFSTAKIFDRFEPSQRELYQTDVMDCGKLIDGLLTKVPSVAPKMKALVNAMTSGTFGADDSRKLFDALCKSLEARLFEQLSSE